MASSTVQGNNKENYAYGDASPTVTAGAYSAGDVVGGLLSFSSLLPNGAGYITGLTMYDLANQKAEYYLYLFADTPATIADNAAFALSDADAQKRVKRIHIPASTWVSNPANDNAFLSLDELNMRIGGLDSENLWAYLVTQGTPTFAATTDLGLTLEALPS